MTALGQTLLCGGVLVLAWGGTALALAYVRASQALDDTLDELTYGDHPALHSCVELMATLNTVRGGCAESGAERGHTHSDSLEA